MIAKSDSCLGTFKLTTVARTRGDNLLSLDVAVFSIILDLIM